MNKSTLKLVLIAATFFAAGVAQGKEVTLQLHLAQVGSQLVAVTPDGRFFSLVCHAPSLTSWSYTADLLEQNSNGKVVTDHYNESYVPSRSPTSPDEKSRFVPVSSAVVTKICKSTNPTGDYTLKIIDQGDSQIADFDKSQNMDADSQHGSRSF